MTAAPSSIPSVKQKPAASSKSWPGVRIVVDTSVSSSWIDIGSSTIRSSGARLTAADPSLPTVTRLTSNRSDRVRATIPEANPARRKTGNV